MSTLHAHFENMYEARKTARALNELGYVKVHLDLAGTFDYEYSSEFGITGQEKEPCLSALVFNTGGYLEAGKAPHISAQSSVSGVSCTEDCTSISTRLCVSIDNLDTDKAAAIIRENGGRIF